MEAVITAISSVGFPIFMCVVLLWYMIKQNEQHQEETQKITEAINELKLAITELTGKIRGE